MACMENVCTNHACGWGDFSNETIKVCPQCGSRVINFWDEQIEHDRQRAEAKYGKEENDVDNDS